MMIQTFYNINTCRACSAYGCAEVVVVVAVVVVAVVQVDGVVYV
jgi:hypothetical protein